MTTIYTPAPLPLQQVQSRVDVFSEIFLVFLGLGTIVGVVVLAYTFYNAYKYRDAEEPTESVERPSLGELPTGGEGGRKLFLSFGLSAIIVISLIVWTYGMLLYVEEGPNDTPGPDDEDLQIQVVGENFQWKYHYENGAMVRTEMVVPANTTVWINATGGDVWHAFGAPSLRVKADAIPGEYRQTWFWSGQAGKTHKVQCYELCGVGHSAMEGSIRVVSQSEFDQWLAEQAPEGDESASPSSSNNATENGSTDDSHAVPNGTMTTNPTTNATGGAA